MAKVEIYSTPSCRYCNDAKRLLDSMSIEYVEHDIQSDIASRETLRARELRTVPQITINEKWIGGYTELAAMKLSGELDKLLVE